MKILFLHTTAFLPIQFGALLDEAEMKIREGHDVYFGFCNEASNFCTQNLTGKKSNCGLCKWTTKHALRNLSKGVHLLPISDYYDKSDSFVEYPLHSIEDLISVEYKKVKIGYSVLSTYISATRNNDPVFDETFVSYVNNLLNISRRFTDAYERILDSINPDLVCLFNGRFLEFRPAFELPLTRGIDVKCFEVFGDHGQDGFKLCYDNCMPHSIDGNIRKIIDLWNQDNEPKEDKIRIGSSFFQNRRHAKPAGDKIYTCNQKEGLLPSNWDESKRNFVIFNSSEDEYTAIGDEYSSLDFFNSQLEGIKTLLSMSAEHKDIHYYLRIHPNLSEIKYSYHTDLLKLDTEFDNITIIPGSDKISTYELMEKSEKVIVFGSTMGLESAFWNKPVINLAGTVYAKSDMCYMPKDMEHLKSLLFDKLQPRDNLFSIQYGYFMMHRDDADRYKFIDFNYRSFRLGNYDLYKINYQKTLGSRRLFAIAQKIVGHYYSVIDKSEPVSIPIKGK